jgi:tryptophan-rich hypothetical protein
MQPARNRLSPKKLLLTKWTAAVPHGKEKHFMVTKVIDPEPPITEITQIEIEAVFSKRVISLHWRELTDPGKWLRGWV